MCDFTSVEPTGRYAINVGDPVNIHDATLGTIGTGGICIQNDPNNFQIDGTYINVVVLGKTVFSGTLNSIRIYFQNGYWNLHTEITQNGGSTSKKTISGISCEADHHKLIYKGTYESGHPIKITQWAREGLHFDNVNLCDAGIPIPAGLPCNFDIWFQNAYTEKIDLTLSRNLILTGRIAGPNGTGIAGLMVEAWDKDHFTKDDALGSDTTNANGFFSIPVHKEDHKEWIFDRKPDVYFKIRHQGNLLHSTEDKVMWNVKQANPVEIQLEMVTDDGA